MAKRIVGHASQPRRGPSVESQSTLPSSPTMSRPARWPDADRWSSRPPWSATGGSSGCIPGPQLRDEDGVLSFGSPIRHLPYNGVIRTRIAADDDDAMRSTAWLPASGTRDVPYMWIRAAQRPAGRPRAAARRPGARPRGDGHRAWTSTSTAGSRSRPQQRGGPARRRARRRPHRPARLRGADPHLLVRARARTPHDRDAEPPLDGRAQPGERLVAYLDGRAVGKCFVRLADLPDSIAIFGVAVRPEARGGGIATALMKEAIAVGVPAAPVARSSTRARWRSRCTDASASPSAAGCRSTPRPRYSAARGRRRPRRA